MLSAFFGTFEDLSLLMFESVDLSQLNVPFSSVEESYEDDDDMDDVEDGYSNDIELRDAEGNTTSGKAIRAINRIVNNPARQSLFDELANIHQIPARHSTLTIDMDIQQSESVHDNLYEMQQPEEEQQQQAAGTYSNSLNTGSSFVTDIILANPTPSRDSVLPQPEPLVPPTLATSTTLYSISEEQQGTFEEDTRRDDGAELKATAAERKAINEEAAQKIEAVLQDKIDGREDVDLMKELRLIELNRRRVNEKVEKGRHNGANLRIEKAMSAIRKLLPREEAAQREEAFKADEKDRRNIVSKEEQDAREKFRQKQQAAIKATAEIEAARQESARQESARQEALRMQPQAHSRANGTEIVESFPSPSDDGPRTPPDLPDGMSGEVQESIDSIN
ncbi:uncharacterized protein TrAtP1_002930 [Trichoderma atroviride]|uniref:uncharacterized protein n=1 Tax=Hypocrea atroviridis TaxID=63577 RepID=UPI00331E0A30|nr:hypothetical protein TrAtP1_002930 [Trichoderma atroviride]